MKWGENSDKAENEIVELVGNIFGAKGVSILLGVATFALLAGANWKWGL